ncbi:MAG TPA: methyltransferase domain-containing protein [Methanosarcinaceae archaeon]|nr:methyltransferase domain-containing protein [Methanosarcinaceae archaeon]
MVEIKYKGACIKLANEVYDPAEDSYLLADAAISYARDGMHVLEIGTGTGFVSSVLLANVNVELTATDINPHAVKCAKSNGIEVIRTDMFDGLKVESCFDMIIFNPPYLPTSNDEKVQGWLNYAFDGGRDGRITVEHFLDEVCGYLAPDGVILLLVSSLTGIEDMSSSMDVMGFDVDIVGREKCSFEELVVIMGKHRHS